MPESKSKENGWREPRFLLQIGIVLVAVVLAYAGLKGTAEGHAVNSALVQESQQKQIDKKVDRARYDECIKRIEKSMEELKEDVNEIKVQQTRIERKVDEILLK